LKFPEGVAFKIFLDIAINAILFCNFRRKAATVKVHGPESVKRGSRDTNAVRTPEFNAQGDISLKVL
jgi:hypothetical protein